VRKRSFWAPHLNDHIQSSEETKFSSIPFERFTFEHPIRTSHSNIPFEHPIRTSHLNVLHSNIPFEHPIRTSHSNIQYIFYFIVQLNMRDQMGARKLRFLALLNMHDQMKHINTLYYYYETNINQNIFQIKNHLNDTINIIQSF
jgi:hypothetical protein